MRRYLIGVLALLILTLGSLAVFAGVQRNKSCVPSGKSAVAGACNASEPAASPEAPRGAIAGNFDPAMSGVCRFACATKLKYKEADVVPQPGAQQGRLTQCPVSGVVFAVDASRPHVQTAGTDYVTCCDGCATKLRQNPGHYLKGIAIVSPSDIETVSFYTVPLVCTAAPRIGCGSRAKPVLLGLETRPSVREAWLNREGTVIAVVWTEAASSQARIASAGAVFSENAMQTTLLSGEEQRRMLVDFQKGKNWLRGADVDRLSLEEADVIVERLLNRINAKSHLSQERAQALKAAFSTAIKEGITKSYSSEINSNPEHVQGRLIRDIESRLLNIGKQYLNETEMNAFKAAVPDWLHPTESDKARGTTG